MPQTKITPAEEAIYKTDFAKFDSNGNGALDGDEMTAMAKFQLGPDATEEKVAYNTQQSLTGTFPTAQRAVCSLLDFCFNRRDGQER